MGKAKRRGRGEGSVYRRKDGLWAGYLTVGYDENGKRRRRVVYGRSKAEVLEKLARLQADVLTGLLTEPQRLTVAQFLRHWLDDAARSALRPSTYVRYDSIIRNHIVPHLGGLKLPRLQPSHVQAFYARLEAEGASARTRELCHVVLHRALGQAVRWGYVARNVCDAVEKPRPERRSIQALAREEAVRLLEAARDDRLCALYVVAITAGLRQGELFGLQWDDVDLKAGAVFVRRTVSEIKGQLVIGEPKTAKARRRVELPAIAVAALREHRKRMLAEGHPGPWVFCDTNGGPLRRSNFLRRSFYPLLERAGVPRIRFHDLRHTSATLLLLQGVHPKVVQERLGHAQVSITLDTYSHVLPSLQREAAETLDQLLRPRKA